MNSTSLAEIDCRNEITNFSLLFFPLINFNTLFYYFKFNIRSCFDSEINLFLAINFHNYKNYKLDYLPKYIASTFIKN